MNNGCLLSHLANEVGNFESEAPSHRVCLGQSAQRNARPFGSAIATAAAQKSSMNWTGAKSCSLWWNTRVWAWAKRSASASSFSRIASIIW